MHVRWFKLPVFIIFYTVFIILLMPERAYAMHIMEGFLPINWCGIWYAKTIVTMAITIITATEVVVAGRPRQINNVAIKNKNFSKG